MKRGAALVLFCFLIIQAYSQVVKKKIPDKLVVLTFDDAVLSHYTNVAPLLKKYKFGGTFFIAEFLQPAFSDKTKYLSWEQISELDKMGFEIANHTQNHTHVNKMDKSHFVTELEYIENKAKEAGVKNPMLSFAYPGYDTAASAIPVLQEKGYLFARIGGGKAYDPLTDHPYLIPSFSTSADNSKEIYAGFNEAKDGKIVILTVHGVPDDAHPWVTTPLSLFEEYLTYLKANKFKVIALRDLQKYIDVKEALATVKPGVNRK